MLETGRVRGLAPALPASWRAGESKYVFKLSRGEYLVTLDFIETEVAAAGLRIFDVEAEGKASIEGLDIFDEAGDFSLLQRSFRVGVFDGWLDLQLVALTGDRGPRVSGIRIEPFSVEESADLSLLKPVLSGRPGLFRNTLAWRPPAGEGWGTAPLAGFNLYRSKAPGGPFAPVNDRLLRVPYLVDRDLAPGTTYYYRVQSQDIAGTRSSASATLALEVPTHSEADPKIYDIRISAADFRRMATRE
ncbi:MAG: malectin domain-containing carbohydrate-binding protein, partial [Planctomycetota bacterium]|nr:malectin domain-containing carbohydrate-binding protein [Planctomycetota bacterium]